MQTDCFLQKRGLVLVQYFWRTWHMWRMAGFGLCTVLMLNQQSPLKGLFIKVRSLRLALVEEGNDDSTFSNAPRLRRKHCV